MYNTSSSHILRINGAPVNYEIVEKVKFYEAENELLKAHFEKIETQNSKLIDNL
ncbi:hypothetical protein C8N25_10670 [Algoriphagus antarcticus]|uniref:Uncharacterized protein n=1 Tax=Algoriphagus antarcticus TaxID=238540 RepID=A0A3E0DWX7_9BACT|nr:hypothetical protein C8N25_10670 [Algoriphagus antarcticus]